jgi:hypothetical protein
MLLQKVGITKGRYNMRKGDEVETIAPPMGKYVESLYTDKRMQTSRMSSASCLVDPQYCQLTPV